MLRTLIQLVFFFTILDCGIMDLIILYYKAAIKEIYYLLHWLLNVWQRWYTREFELKKMSPENLT